MTVTMNKHKPTLVYTNNDIVKVVSDNAEIMSSYCFRCTLKLEPWQQTIIDYYIIVAKFRNRGGKEGAPQAMRNLQEKGIGSLRVKKEMGSVKVCCILV